MVHHVSATTWRKSTYSTGNGGECVELSVVESRSTA